jgi:hypothetical protein
MDCVRSLFVSLLLACLALTGCGSSSRGTVNGKVLFNGKPVTEGSLLFTPQDSANQAKPATGIVQPDGTFALGTEKDGDGAAIGLHNVFYTAPAPVGPEWLGYGPKPQQKFSPFHGLVPKESAVEVKAGANELTIELTRPQ